MPLAPTIRQGGGFLREQVLTGRNINENWFIDLVYGGLNYQIQHHLFPSMPRKNLRRVRPIVRTYCQRQGVAAQTRDCIGERARGKDKSKATKSPKALKAARRSLKVQQQMRDALKRLTDARADVVVAAEVRPTGGDC